MINRRGFLAGASALAASRSSWAQDSLLKTAHKLTDASSLTIGLVGPMSGQAAAVGDYMKHGALVGAAYLNQKGGILGRTVKVHIEDDGNIEGNARLVANRMSSLYEIPFVVGHAISGTAIAASDVYTEKGMFLLSAINADGFNLSHSPFIYRTIPAARSYERHLKDEIIKSGRSRIAIIRSQATVNIDFSRLLEKDLTSEGRNVVFTPEINNMEMDFNSIVSRMKESAVDLVVLAVPSLKAGLIAHQSVTQGFIDLEKGPQERPLLMGYSELVSPEYLKGAGGPGIGAKTIEGTKVVSIHGCDMDELKEDLKKIDPHSNLLKIYEENHIDPYEVYGWLIFSAFQIIDQAISAVDTLDSAAIRAVLRTYSFETIRGRISFNLDGDPSHPDDMLELFEWQADLPKFIKKYGGPSVRGASSP